MRSYIRLRPSTRAELIEDYALIAFGAVLTGFLLWVYAGEIWRLVSVTW